MKKNKLFLSIGTIAAVATPIVAVVSCGSDDKNEVSAEIESLQTRAEGTDERHLVELVEGKIIKYDPTVNFPASYLASAYGLLPPSEEREVLDAVEAIKAVYDDENSTPESILAAIDEFNSHNYTIKNTYIPSLNAGVTFGVDRPLRLYNMFLKGVADGAVVSQEMSTIDTILASNEGIDFETSFEVPNEGGTFFPVFGQIEHDEIGDVIFDVLGRTISKDIVDTELLPSQYISDKEGVVEDIRDALNSYVVNQLYGEPLTNEVLESLVADDLTFETDDEEGKLTIFIDNHGPRRMWKFTNFNSQSVVNSERFGNWGESHSIPFGTSGLNIIDKPSVGMPLQAGEHYDLSILSNYQLFENITNIIQYGWTLGEQQDLVKAIINIKNAIFNKDFDTFVDLVKDFNEQNYVFNTANAMDGLVPDNVRGIEYPLRIDLMKTVDFNDYTFDYIDTSDSSVVSDIKSQVAANTQDDFEIISQSSSFHTGGENLFLPIFATTPMDGLGTLIPTLTEDVLSDANVEDFWTVVDSTPNGLPSEYAALTTQIRDSNNAVVDIPEIYDRIVRKLSSTSYSMRRSQQAYVAQVGNENIVEDKTQAEIRAMLPKDDVTITADDTEGTLTIVISNHGPRRTIVIDGFLEHAAQGGTHA